ncbi:antibiotic biosynthesis monooxygenase family protein [Deinococcus yavapaiensis]|uniref:Heme-degrading monooxygenase HmoA n=1 Tax=Deinococcus yavapaiensis KR-236 TaxID=694435 RepID=A0A318S9F9_9DEIO|nr:antibiotic biosynthesis monooxygenase [Deinococcus yavapaiensis]PYE52847.1 heme-degrading monooxygenase HmoA [Deinococcus yavapaiensis KR-236]
MITVANRIFVAPEFAEQFEERFRARAGLVDTMPGFVANHVLRPTKLGEPYVFLTFWESHEAFRSWTESDAFKQGHARSGSLPREAFSGPNVLEVHEVVTSSDPRF